MNIEVKYVKPIYASKNELLNYSHIIASRYSNERLLKVKYLGGGSFGRVVELLYNNKSFILKFILIKEMIDKEVYDLELLSKNTYVKFPAVYKIYYQDNEVPLDCYIMEKIEGSNLFYNIKLFFLPFKEKIKIADSVTSALHSIHNITNKRFGDSRNPNCNTWLEYYKPFVDKVYFTAKELYQDRILNKEIFLLMESAIVNFEEIFSEEVTNACLIHGDLNIFNIMVDKKGKLKGFIDPLNSMYADNEYDLFQLDNLFGNKFYLKQIYKEKYPVSEKLDIKLAFYALWNEVYCFIKTRKYSYFIFKPIIKNMRKQLSILK